MDKKTITGIIVAVIVILSVGYFLYNSQNSTPTPIPTSKTTSTPKPTSTPEPTSTTTPKPTPTTTPNPTSAPTSAPTPSIGQLTLDALTKSFAAKTFYLLNACASFTPPTPSGQTPEPRSQIPFIVDSGNRLLRGGSTILDQNSGFELVPLNILLDAKYNKYFVDVNIKKDGKYATWIKTSRVTISGTNYDNQDTYFIKFMASQTNDYSQIIRLQYTGGCCTSIFYMKDSVTPYLCNAISFVDPADGKAYSGIVAVPSTIGPSCQWFNLVHLDKGQVLESNKLQGESVGSYTNSLPQLLIKCADYTKCN